VKRWEHSAGAMSREEKNNSNWNWKRYGEAGMGTQLPNLSTRRDIYCYFEKLTTVRVRVPRNLKKP